MAQPRSEISDKRVAIDVFDGTIGSSRLVEFPSACGVAKEDPIGSTIAGAFESFGIDEGFQKIDGVMIEPLPVRRNHPGTFGQKVRGQMCNPYPRQNQKAAVVSQQMQVVLPNLGRPSNETVSAADMPRG